MRNSRWSDMSDDAKILTIVLYLSYNTNIKQKVNEPSRIVLKSNLVDTVSDNYGLEILDSELLKNDEPIDYLYRNNLIVSVNIGLDDVSVNINHERIILVLSDAKVKYDDMHRDLYYVIARELELINNRRIESKVIKLIEQI